MASNWRTKTCNKGVNYLNIHKKTFDFKRNHLGFGNLGCILDNGIQSELNDQAGGLCKLPDGSTVYLRTIDMADQ